MIVIVIPIIILRITIWILMNLQMRLIFYRACNVLMPYEKYKKRYLCKYNHLTQSLYFLEYHFIPHNNQTTQTTLCLPHHHALTKPDAHVGPNV